MRRRDHGDGDARRRAGGVASAAGNRETAFNYFVNQDFTQFQSAGIIGNLMQESGVDPTAVQSGGPGRGIAQWSEGARWDDLERFAAARDRNKWALDLQLDFIMHEFKTVGYGYGDLKASKNVDDATRIFANQFEICGTCMMDNRIDYAHQALEDFGGPDATFPDRSVSGVVEEDGSITVFARRDDGHMYTKNRANDGTWADWTNRGGAIESGPDAAITGFGSAHMHVVARGENGKVHYKRQTADGWQEWHTAFSDFDTPYAPAIVTIDGNSLIVLAVRASDRQLMKRRYNAGTGWEAWTTLGNGDHDGYTSGPDAALREGSKIDVVIRGPGGKVHHIVRQTDGSWTQPGVLGDKITSPGVAPAVASRAAGSVDVLARGKQGYVFRKTLSDGSWDAWDLAAAPGRLNQGPDLVAQTGAAPLQMLGRDTDGRIIRCTWIPGQGWSQPIAIPAN